MKNKAINRLNYTGIVTLSQYRGNKKIKIAQVHNTGGNPLFRFLADCLIGDYTIAKATRPTKIMLLKQTEDKENKSYTKESGFIYLLTKPTKIEEDLQIRVRYSFMIPQAQIESLNDYTDLGIGLYTDDAVGITEDDIKNYAAFCKVDLSGKNFTGAALLVDWDLIISNNVSSNQEI